MASFKIFFLTLALWSLLQPLTSASLDATTTAQPLASTSGTPCFIGAHDLPPTTMKVLVPNRTAFVQFVDCTDPNYVRGFSVDVFKSAFAILRPQSAWETMAFQCFDVQSDNSSYNELVQCLLDGSVDAVVGDVTIAADRLEIASFSQPYVDSGVVILAPMEGLRSGFPVFFAPFTKPMWVSIGVFAIVTAIVLWYLELNDHPEFQDGGLKQGIQKSLWFVAQLMVFFKRELISNPLAKAVLIGWIAFIIVLSSAYTASFSAILTVRNRAPLALNMHILQNESYKIGYQTGSIVYDHLTRTLGISDDRLEPLTSTGDYVEALSKGPHRDGGVAAILDEIPYVNLFLSELPDSSCNYVTVGPQLTNEGFGFAFPLGSRNLAKAFSMAILNLSESGQLLRLQTGAEINDYRCPTHLQATQLDLVSSQSLYLLLGVMFFVCIILVLVARVRSRSLEESERNTAVGPGAGAGNSRDSNGKESDYCSCRDELSPMSRLQRLGTFP